MSKKERLKKLIRQPSTARGIIFLAALAGITITPAHIEAIVILAGIALSILEILRDEEKQKTT